MQTPFDRLVHDAIEGGVTALLSMQDADGLWREFDLKPGASQAWTTAWVGWCLRRCMGQAACTSGGVVPGWATAARQRALADACGRAARAVIALRGPRGWGYNRASGADADSTAWVLRFLAACGAGMDPLPWLAPYVDAAGGVHTFVDEGHGRWTDAHDDVAATVGLALLHGPASRPLARRIAAGLAHRWPVRTFWWSTPAYGRAWCLRLLAALPGGGAPAALQVEALSWLRSQPAPTDAFEAAHRLMMATQLGDRRCADVLATQLLDLANSGGWPGGWPGACHLLVPSRNDGADGADDADTPHREIRGLLSTSLSVMALTEFVAGHEKTPGREAQGFRSAPPPGGEARRMS